MLANIPLDLKGRMTWLNKLKQIKRIVDIACYGKDPAMCKKWKLHWDIQLCKMMKLQL